MGSRAAAGGPRGAAAASLAADLAGGDQLAQQPEGVGAEGRKRGEATEAAHEDGQPDLLADLPWAGEQDAEQAAQALAEQADAEQRDAEAGNEPTLEEEEALLEQESEADAA